MAREDDFMYTRQEDPRPEFVQSLKTQLDAQDNGKKSASRSRWSQIGQRAAAIALLLMSVFAVSFAASPDVRAMTRELLDFTGKVPVEVAQESIGFALPQYLPEGYELGDMCSSNIPEECERGIARASLDVSEFGGGWATLIYGDPTGGDNSTRLIMYVTSPPERMNTSENIARTESRWRSLGETGAYDAPDINGATGYLTVRRLNDGTTRYIDLQWYQDQRHYKLVMYNNQDDVMTTDDLKAQILRIARSIPSIE